MADVVDMAVEIEGEHLAAATRAARVGVLSGAPGTCGECTYWFPRLVDGLCGFCRDGRQPPDDWEPQTPPTTPREAVPASREEPVMPAKSIQLPASAVAEIAAVEKYAQSNVLSLGAAAAALIARGMAVPLADAPAPIGLGDVHFDALLDEVRRRFEGVDDDHDEKLGAEITRREAAEARLATIQSVFAA